MQSSKWDTATISVLEISFYFCDIAAGTASYKLYDSDNLSGTDYVLYSKLNESNVSLSIILHGIYSHTESNNR